MIQTVEPTPHPDLTPEVSPAYRGFAGTDGGEQNPQVGGLDPPRRGVGKWVGSRKGPIGRSGRLGCGRSPAAIPIRLPPKEKDDE